jgi:hypothetical protein
LENPLSAQAHAAWRAQLKDKRDRVDTSPAEYVIHTSTSSGELAEATLELRKEDLRPVRETLQFRNQEWIEISEAPGEESSSRPQEAQSSASALNNSRGRADASSATIAEELRVIAALHGIGVDLGEPIEVTRGPNRIIVNGTGVSTERRKQIEETVGGLRNVELNFARSDAAPVKSSASSRQVVSSPSPFENHLRERLGGADEFSKFADQILQRSETMMARVHALRGLAERFGPDIESQFSSDDRRILAGLLAEHAEAFSSEVNRIVRSMDPVLGEKASRGEAKLTGGWQVGTLQLWTIAQDADRLLGLLLAGSRGNAQDATPAALAAALARLETEAGAYRRIIRAVER